MTVPQFTAREEDELVAELESEMAASNEVVLSTFGRSLDASLPVAEQVVPAAVQKNVAQHVAHQQAQQQVVEGVANKLGKV